MRPSVSSFASAFVCLHVASQVSLAQAQSTHLSALERLVPAFAAELTVAGATGGWSGAWLAPAAGGDATGVLVGVERLGFSGLTSSYAAVRVRAGAVWQVSVASITVSELFDRDLLEANPELSILQVSAQQVGVDAGISPRSGSWVSGGVRNDRDELLSVVRNHQVARVSLYQCLPLRTAGSVSVERPVGDESHGGRLSVSVAKRFSHRRVSGELGVGARLGRLWTVEAPSNALGASVTASLSGTLGAAFGYREERSGAPSLVQRVFTAGVSLRVSALAAALQKTYRSESQGGTESIAILLSRRLLGPCP